MTTAATKEPLPAAAAQPEEGELVELPASYNYIGVFLTLRCPYRCSYCINRAGGPGGASRPELGVRDWIAFFERLQPGDVPVTLQGGEPGLHPQFVELVEAVTRMHQVDILTNLAFDLDAFIRRVPPSRLDRDAPYAPIRVSYHPRQFSLFEIVRRVQRMQSAGFRVGLYGVLHPEQREEMKRAERVCARLGLDFRTKPFLGRYRGRLHGTYAYPDASSGRSRACECAPSELLIAPDGGIHRCHHHLYAGRPPAAHVADARITLAETFSACSDYGQCNPCDVKVKNNRFQRFGHVAVRIRFPHPDGLCAAEHGARRAAAGCNPEGAADDQDPCD